MLSSLLIPFTYSIRIIFSHKYTLKIIKALRFYIQQAQYNEYRKQYNIHPSFRFSGIDIELIGNGKIIIHENSYIGNRSSIATSRGNSVTIGKNCSISHNVRIYTTNRNPESIINNTMTTSVTGDVIIGDNVWIGANTFINHNITIGNNVVIGANSVITKSIPSNSIAVGAPAKVIKSSKKTNETIRS